MLYLIVDNMSIIKTGPHKTLDMSLPNKVPECFKSPSAQVPQVRECPPSAQMILVCHVIFLDHTIKVSSGFMDKEPITVSYHPIKFGASGD